MTHITKKAVIAKAQRQEGSATFSSKPADPDAETCDSDSEWLDDGEDDEDEEDNHNKMASLYSGFLPRHLQPKTVEIHDEIQVWLAKILRNPD